MVIHLKLILHFSVTQHQTMGGYVSGKPHIPVRSSDTGHESSGLARFFCLQEHARNIKVDTTRLTKYLQQYSTVIQDIYLRIYLRIYPRIWTRIGTRI